MSTSGMHNAIMEAGGKDRAPMLAPVNACRNAKEMWKAIERLIRGENINKQDVETNLFWAFGKFTSKDGESLESYYSRSGFEGRVDKNDKNYQKEPSFLASMIENMKYEIDESKQINKTNTSLATEFESVITSLRYLGKTSEEDHPVEVAVFPKFDMPHHQSKLSPEDVESLAKKYDISLDLHPCAPSEGWMMDQLLEEVIGKGARGKIFRETFFEMKWWKDKIFFIDRRSIPDAMAWRHHDLYGNDMFPGDGFSVEDVKTLAKKVIDLRPVHPGLLFFADVATVCDFLGFHPIFNDTEGNIEQNTTPLFPVGQPILDKTESKLEVEVEDPKVIAIGKRKKLKQLGMMLRKSRRMMKRRRPENEHNSAHLSLRESANESVHNYFDIDGQKDKESPHRIEPFVNKFNKPLYADKEEVFLSRSNAAERGSQGLNIEEGESFCPGEIYVPKWGIPWRCRIDSHMWCRELMVHLAPPAVQEESNALTNSIAFDRAWFSLARGAMAQINILERFENLQEDYSKLAETHDECSDTVWKLVTARKLHLMYDKLFEKGYPFVMKIASGYRHSVAGLLKIHPDPAPAGGSAAPTISSALVVPPPSKKKI
nr:hypothetical protein [Tanacetum cinerariifolium]